MRPDITLWRHIKSELYMQWCSAAFLSPWWHMDEKRECHMCGKIERPTGEQLITLYDGGIIRECRYHGTPDRMTVVDCFTNQEVSLFLDRGTFIQGCQNIIDDARYWTGSVWRFVRDAPRNWTLFWLRAISYYSRKLADSLDKAYR